jgi:hypothetical protein
MEGLRDRTKRFALLRQEAEELLKIVIASARKTKSKT